MFVGETSAKYTYSIDVDITVTVNSIEDPVDEYVAVNYLIDALSNTSGIAYGYFRTRQNQNSSLDSTGGNFGRRICAEEFNADFGLSYTNYSFCYDQRLTTVNGTQVTFIDIYFANTYIGTLDQGDIVTDVYKYNAQTQVWTIGTCGLTAKYVEVNGFRELTNAFNLSTYVIESTVVPPTSP